jgi:hypothetical protein
MLPSLQLDLLNLIYLPLMVITIRDLITNWHSVWDNHLTARDRFILQKVVIFLIMPFVVYCHEMGHALSIEYFGGRVAEFHFGLFWGFVVPQGVFTPDQTVLTYLAGNAVQIAIGLIAGFSALFISSPPVPASATRLCCRSQPTRTGGGRQDLFLEKFQSHCMISMWAPPSPGFSTTVPVSGCNPVHISWQGERCGDGPESVIRHHKVSTAFSP